MATRILVVDDSPTIRRVVSTILERHGYEPALASDGQDAMNVLSSGEVKADLVLVDFVMPRMNGYQFCRALRSHAELAMTPVVLMSAKGDRIRDQFVQQTGAIDAITKPFDAQALVAVVENALRRVNSGRASSARLPDLEPEEPAAGPLELETRRTHVAQIVATKLAHVVARVLSDKPGASPGEVAALLTERLVSEALLEMVEAVRDVAGERDDPTSILAGDLGVVPIGAILQLLQVENQSGVLACWNGSAEVTATFRNGLIDLVQSSGAGDEFRLGRYFVEEGILAPKEIEEVVKRAGGDLDVEGDAPRSSVHVKSEAPDTIRMDESSRVTMPGLASVPRLVAASRAPLGTLLLESKKISEAQLREALTQQSSELLYEVLRWPRGRFELRRGPVSALAESARLGLPVASMVMEGFRRVDEWRVLERTLGSFDGVLVRDEPTLASFDVGSLPPKEKIVLDAVDGERTVRGIIAASHMSSFDACRVLVQFLEARILRRRAG